MFVGDQPSTINYQALDINGNHVDWIGRSEAAIVASSKAIYNDFTALVDPVEKSAAVVAQSGENAVVGGFRAAYGAAGDAANAVASKLGRVVAPLVSDVKWLVAGVLILGALYLFGPLLLAYGRRSA